MPTSYSGSSHSLSVPSSSSSTTNYCRNTGGTPQFLSQSSASHRRAVVDTLLPSSTPAPHLEISGVDSQQQKRPSSSTKHRHPSQHLPSRRLPSFQRAQSHLRQKRARTARYYSNSSGSATTTSNNNSLSALSSSSSSSAEQQRNKSLASPTSAPFNSPASLFSSSSFSPRSSRYQHYQHFHNYRHQNRSSPYSPFLSEPLLLPSGLPVQQRNNNIQNSVIVPLSKSRGSRRMETRYNQDRCNPQESSVNNDSGLTPSSSSSSSTTRRFDDNCSNVESLQPTNDVVDVSSSSRSNAYRHVPLVKSSDGKFNCSSNVRNDEDKEVENSQCSRRHKFSVSSNDNEDVRSSSREERRSIYNATPAANVHDEHTRSNLLAQGASPSVSASVASALLTLEDFFAATLAGSTASRPPLQQQLGSMKIAANSINEQEETLKSFSQSLFSVADKTSVTCTALGMPMNPIQSSSSSAEKLCSAVAVEKPLNKATATATDNTATTFLPGNCSLLLSDEAFCNIAGDSISWTARVSALESRDPTQQITALTELRDWLTYMTSDSLRGIPSERLTLALIDIIAGRYSVVPVPAGAATSTRSRYSGKAPNKKYFNSKRSQRGSQKRKSSSSGLWQQQSSDKAEKSNDSIRQSGHSAEQINNGTTVKENEIHINDRRHHDTKLHSEGNREQDEQGGEHDWVDIVSSTACFEAKPDTTNHIEYGNKQNKYRRDGDLDAVGHDHENINNAIDTCHQNVFATDSSNGSHFSDLVQKSVSALHDIYPSNNIEKHHSRSHSFSVEQHYLEEEVPEEEEEEEEERQSKDKVVVVYYAQEYDNDNAINDMESNANRRLIAAECLHHLLDCYPMTARFFLSGDGVDVLCEQLGRIEYIDLGENIVICLQLLAPEIPTRLLSAGAIKALLDIIGFFPLSTQLSMIVTVTTLLIYVLTKEDHQKHVEPCMSQLLALLYHDDDQLLRWAALGLRRVLENVSRQEDDSFTLEVFNSLTEKHRVHKRLLELLKSFVGFDDEKHNSPKGASFDKDTRVMTSNGYLVALDILYALSICCYSDERVAIDLLESNIFKVLVEYLLFQATPGQDPLLTSYTISFLLSLFPSLHIAPSEMLGDGRKIIQLQSNRAAIFVEKKNNSSTLEYLCKVLTPMLLESSLAPSCIDSVQALFLSYCLTLTELLLCLGETELGCCLIESVNRQHFLGLIASTLATLQQTSIVDMQDSFTYQERGHSETAILAGLLLASNLLKFDNGQLLIEFNRQGIFKRLLLLCEAKWGGSTSDKKLHMRRPSIGSKRSLALTLQAARQNAKQLSNLEQLLWTSVQWMFDETNINKSNSAAILVNINILIRWSACELALKFVRSPLNGDKDLGSGEIKLQKIFNFLQKATGYPSDEDNIMLGALRRRLLQRFSKDEGISSFEILEYDGVEAICNYLFGYIIPAEPIMMIPPTNGVNDSAMAANSSTPLSSNINSHHNVSALMQHSQHQLPTTLPIKRDLNLHVQRLLLFIQGLCVTNECDVDTLVWPESGVFLWPLDLRPLLCLSRLLMGCIERCERLLPLELLTAAQPSSAIFGSNNDGLGAIPRHLRPGTCYHTLFQIAKNQPSLHHLLTQKQQFRPITSSRDNETLSPTALTARKEPPLSIGLTSRQLLEEDNGVSRVYPHEKYILMAPPAFHHQLMYSPQSLFDFLGTELKLNATVTVGQTISCELRLLPNETTSFDDGNMVFSDRKESKKGLDCIDKKRCNFLKLLLAQNIKILQFPLYCPVERNELEHPSADMGYKDQQTTTNVMATAATTTITENEKTNTTPNLPTALDSERHAEKDSVSTSVAEKYLGNEAANPTAVTLMLQLSIDARTPAAMLQQTLVHHVNKRVNWLRRKMLRSKDSSYLPQDFAPSTNASTNKQDNHASLSSCSEIATESSTMERGISAYRYERLLTTIINGHIVPPHMPLAEALCRFSNCILIPRQAATMAGNGKRNLSNSSNWFTPVAFNSFSSSSSAASQENGHILSSETTVVCNNEALPTTVNKNIRSSSNHQNDYINMFSSSDQQCYNLDGAYRSSCTINSASATELNNNGGQINVEDQKTNYNKPLVHHPATIMKQGAWLLLDKSVRFIIMTAEEERARSSYLARYHQPQQQRSTKGYGFDDTNATSSSSSTHVVHHRKHTPFHYVWGTEHSVSANLSSRLETPEAIEANVRIFKSMREFYVPLEYLQLNDSDDRMSLQKNINVYYIDKQETESVSTGAINNEAAHDSYNDKSITSTTTISFIKILDSSSLLPAFKGTTAVFELVGQPFTDRNNSQDADKDQSKKQTIVVSLGELLAYLQLRHYYQSLGWSTPPFLNALKAATSNGLFHPYAEPICPIETLTSLASIMCSFDLRGFTSPIISNTVNVQFSHGALYATFLEDVDDSNHDRSKLYTLRSPLHAIVQETLQAVRGWNQTTEYSEDLLLYAGSILSTFIIKNSTSSHNQSMMLLPTPQLKLDEARKSKASSFNNKNTSSSIAAAADLSKIKSISVSLSNGACGSSIDDVLEIDEDEDEDGGDEIENAEFAAVQEDDDEEQESNSNDESSDDYHDDDDGTSPLDEEEDEGEDEEEEEDDAEMDLTLNHYYCDYDAECFNTTANDHRQSLSLFSDPDSFQGHEKLAAAFQMIVLVHHLIDMLLLSNRALYTKKPNLFLSSLSHPSVKLFFEKSTESTRQSFQEAKDENMGLQLISPLFFPSAEQLQYAQTSKVLTAKVMRQLNDPIAIASFRIPNWILAFATAIPPLLSLATRKLLHMSTAYGSVTAITEFTERLKRDVETLGALQLPTARRPPISIHSSKSKQTVFKSAEEALLDGASDFNFTDCFEDISTLAINNDSTDRPNLTLVAMGQSVFRLGDGNRRRQWRRAVDLRQILTRQRTKIRLFRNQILASATKVMDFFHSNTGLTSLQATMEIEFIDEEGSGSAPTLEYYSEVFDQLIAQKAPRLFRPERPHNFLYPQPYSSDPSNVLPHQLQRPKRSEGVTACNRQFSSPDSAANSTTCNYNATQSQLSLEIVLFDRFKLMGQLYAKALMDSRLVDLPLHPLFWKFVISPIHLWPSMANEAALNLVDPVFCKHLCQLRELGTDDKQSLTPMALTFVLPGSDPEIELIPNGSQISVTHTNLEDFIKSCCKWALYKGVVLQIWAFRFGIATFMPLSSLCLFLPRELSGAVIGCLASVDRDEYWTMAHLEQAIAPDHGYTSESPEFHQFLEVISELTRPQRRAFLKFCTGTSTLPRGGFLALRPQMKVVRKAESESLSAGSIDTPKSIQLLPSVMACTNYVKLPSYTSKEQLRQKLFLALEEGQGAFTLS